MGAVGAPAGVRGVPVHMHSVVIPPSASLPFDGLDSVYVASLFMDRARYHFRRYGRSASVKVDAKPTIFHATQPLPLRVAGACNIYTIHDIVPLRLPYTTLENKRYFLQLIRHLGRTADRIVTVSEAARNDLITYCGIEPNKVVNTYQTVEFPPTALAGSDEDAAQLVQNVFDLKHRGYLLFYGALEPKKNVGRLIDAFMTSGITLPLVIAGGLGWEYEGDLKRIDAANGRGSGADGRNTFQTKVRRITYLPLHHLVSLIRCARAVVFPSLYEGFGLPVVEAMLLGTPVITSNVASLPEVAGEAALLVNPLDVRDIASAIVKIDSDDALCAELVSKGRVQAQKFSRQAHKARLGRVYEDTLAMRAQ